MLVFCGFVVGKLSRKTQVWETRDNCSNSCVNILHVIYFNRYLIGVGINLIRKNTFFFEKKKTAFRLA